MAKAFIRKDMLVQRSQLTAEDCRGRSLKIQERFLALPEFEAAQTVALYSPFRNEVSTEAVFRRGREVGKCLVFPRIRQDQLEFVGVEDFASMSAGVFGILEPSGSSILPIEGVDLFVVPGLAFDKRGHRLGFGRGFYDRILHRAAPEATLVGLCFEFQLFTTLPVEEHDIPMDVLVTESRVCHCGESADVSTPFFRGGNEP